MASVDYLTYTEKRKQIDESINKRVAFEFSAKETKQQINGLLQVSS